MSYSVMGGLQPTAPAQGLGAGLGVGLPSLGHAAPFSTSAIMPAQPAVLAAAEPVGGWAFRTCGPPPSHDAVSGAAGTTFPRCKNFRVG